MTARITGIGSARSARDLQALEIFQAKGSGDRSLLENDCLSHKEVADILRRALTTDFKAPFSFLDLAGAQVTRGAGVDLSAPALEIAVERFRDAPFRHEF